MGDFSITGNYLLIAFVGLVVVILALIFLFRIDLARKSESGFAEKYAGKKWASPLMARVKYPDVNIFKWSPTFLWAGIVTSLLLTLLAFNWTRFEDKIKYDLSDLDIEEELEVQPPQTAEPPPPPPPPPPPVIEEVPEEVIEEDESVTFEDQSIDEETVIEEKPPEIKEEAPPPPPPPPPPPKPKVEEIFKVVEENPRFPGCEDVAGGKEEKEKCAKEKLLEFIYKNIKYPAIARENGIQGMCVVHFVVEKNGTITDVELVRDIGAGCGEEAVRVVGLMNEMGERWSPGKQRGQPVRVQYNLPVRFKLEN